MAEARVWSRPPKAPTVVMAAWSAILVLAVAALCQIPSLGLKEGSVFDNLTDFVIFGSVVFETMAVVTIFVFRRKYPNAERPYRAFGYPVIPALYILGAATILIMLFVYRASSTWPGLVIVLLGVPVYWLFSSAERRGRS